MLQLLNAPLTHTLLFKVLMYCCYNFVLEIKVVYQTNISLYGHTKLIKIHNIMYVIYIQCTKFVIRARYF